MGGAGMGVSGRVCPGVALGLASRAELPHASPPTPRSPLRVIPGWSRVSGGREGDPAATAMQGNGALAPEAP